MFADGKREGERGKGDGERERGQLRSSEFVGGSKETRRGGNEGLISVI